MTRNCSICGSKVDPSILPGFLVEVNCPMCGRFQIESMLDSDLRLENYLKGDRWRLSAAIRSQNLQGSAPRLTTENVQSFLESVHPPRNPIEAVDAILKFLVRKAPTTDQFIPIEPANDYPIVCARTAPEFLYYLRVAGQLEVLEQTGEAYRPAVAGWKRLAALESTRVPSDIAFVAMHFAKELDSLWESGISPGIAATGYVPFRVDAQQFNEKICDHIVAAIKRCAFLVADVTNQRQGVYFEAGLAMGLGKPVIWMVDSRDATNIHFDTRQYNHIIWKTPIDARDALIDRIRATIPPVHARREDQGIE